MAATFISEGALLWRSGTATRPNRPLNTLDVGVSYALAGVIAVLTYRIASPYRFLYLLGVLAVYGAPLGRGRTFTDLGHLPLCWSDSPGIRSPGRAARRNPADGVHTVVHRLRRKPGSSATP